MPVCKEKYQDGKLVSRLCIKGDIFFLKQEFTRPEYELSEVDSCDQCPLFPSTSAPTSPTQELSKDEIRKLIKETLKDKEFLKDLIKEILE